MAKEYYSQTQRPGAVKRIIDSSRGTLYPVFAQGANSKTNPAKSKSEDTTASKAGSVGKISKFIQAKESREENVAINRIVKIVTCTGMDDNEVDPCDADVEIGLFGIEIGNVT